MMLVSNVEVHSRILSAHADFSICLSVCVCATEVECLGWGTRLVSCVTFDLLDLHPALMFLARVAVALGCVCIGVVGKSS